jgi:MATE family multidrug resistance protein
VIGTCVELVIPMAVFLSPKYERLYATARAWRPRWGAMRDLLRLGWPGALMFGNEMVCWAIFMVAQVGHFGTLHSTAGWIAHQWMSMSFMPTYGISIAISAMVGKAIGAGKPDEAAARAWLGLKVAVVYMSLCGLVFVVFRRGLVGMFIDAQATAADREVLLRLGSRFLIATAAFQFFDGVAMSLSGALRGAGDTRWPGVATILLSWTVIVGGGWAMVYLAPGLESVGPWMAAALYIILLSGAIFARFLGGKWRGMKVVGEPAP